MVRLLQQKKRTFSILTTFAIAAFGLHLFVLFLFVLQGLNIRQLSLRKPPNFVEIVDDESTTNIDNLAREPEAIRQFVTKTMTSIFNWSGMLPAETPEQVTNPKPDPGILVRTSQGNTQRISSKTWIAGFALSEDFRKGFLRKIAEITPPEVFSKNPQQAMSAQLFIKRVYPPKKIAAGKWRVGIVADLIQKKQSDERKVITPFNKDLLVRAVDYFDAPLTEDNSNLQKAIRSIRADRLEIYEIRNLCLLDDNSNQGQNQFNQCV
ncbi:hypothetical protein [Fortiea contorta]|uniref:hypothetical protein n=1 Tax=Fortiea contorta TaxID=1892405 RepID=UPI0003477471|nr:hypothetical protein [Fortiea contorta]